jgi:hypothetical protein
LPKYLYKETVSEIEQVPVQNLTGRQSTKEAFAILTREFLARRDINGSAKAVYAAMLIESKGTGLIAMSHGALGIVAGCTRVTAMGACAALGKAKVIERYGEKVDQIQPYRILNVRNPKAAGAKFTVKTIPPLFCPQCKRRVRALPKEGPCRDCKWNAKVDRRIEAKLRKA